MGATPSQNPPLQPQSLLCVRMRTFRYNATRVHTVTFHSVQDDFDLISAPLSSHAESPVLGNTGSDGLVHPYSCALFSRAQVHNHLGICLVNIAPKTWHIKIETSLFCGPFFLSVVSTRVSAGVCFFSIFSLILLLECFKVTWNHSFV